LILQSKIKENSPQKILLEMRQNHPRPKYLDLIDFPLYRPSSTISNSHSSIFFVWLENFTPTAMTGLPRCQAER
jgi:hypothetical protein